MEMFHPAKRPKWLLASFILICAGGWAWAVNPLPPQLEDAPVAAQQDYLQRDGAKSQSEKIAVGKKRYRQRMQKREQIIKAMYQKANQRRDYIRQQVGVASPGTTRRADLHAAEKSHRLRFAILTGTALVVMVLFVLGIRRMPAQPS